MKKYVVLILFIIISCKKNDRTEIESFGNNIIEVTYKNDKVNYSKTTDKFTKKTITDFFYNEKGNTTLAREFYGNGKIKNVLKLDKEPNYYLETGFYPNGKMEFEGGTCIINKKKYRSGSWIFYNKDGTVFSTVEFGSDNKGNEWIIQEKKIPKGYKIRYENGKFVDEK